MVSDGVTPKGPCAALPALRSPVDLPLTESLRVPLRPTTISLRSTRYVSATTGLRLAGPWVAPGPWRQDVRISVSEVTAEGGYMSAGVLIEGCRSVDGHTPSALDNGTYLLQPPSYRRDAATGAVWLGADRYAQRHASPAAIPPQHRHYVLSSLATDPATGLPARRHLRFNAKAKRWEVAPLCDGCDPALKPPVAWLHPLVLAITPLPGTSRRPSCRSGRA